MSLGQQTAVSETVAVPEAGRRAWVEQIMGMPISLHLRGPDLDAPEVVRAVAEVFADLRETDRLFSPYRPDSLVGAVNRGELLPAGYPPPLAEVVELCERARERTGGYFDAELPDGSGGIRFNPTGLVKGWAAERAATRLRDLAGRDFCLNAGGDVVVGGTAPWRIGVEDPRQPQRVVATVTVTGGAVATSGSAHRGAHILVPQTGAPARDLIAATVTGPSLTWADIYATAAVARGRTALRWLGRLPDGYAGLVVKPDGTTLVTGSWPVPEPAAGGNPAVSGP